MKTLRQDLTVTMARVHDISEELAAYHVSQMSDSELAWRREKYAEMELSAAGSTPPERSTSVLPGSDARNDDGRLAALNCVSEEAYESTHLAVRD